MKNSCGMETLESMSQAVWYNEWTLDKFKKYLKGEILEIGCGIGNFTKPLASYGKVWAIDIKKKYIQKTKQRVNGKAKIGFGDIEKGQFFFNGKKFDNVICLNVLEHIKDDDRALSNLFRLLKSGGRLILLVPSHQFLYSEIDKSIGHFRRYEKLKLIKKLERLGFNVISARNINFIGALGWFIASKILRETVVGEGNIKMFNLIAPFVLPIEDLIEPPIGTSILTVAEKS